VLLAASRAAGAEDDLGGSGIACHEGDLLEGSRRDGGDVRPVADRAGVDASPAAPRGERCIALELEREAVDVSREVLRNHGNMSSPTLLFILKQLREDGAARPCVALGFVPGLMAEAKLFV